MNKKPIYYLVPVLLAFIMFGSNFLSTNLFKDNVYSFSVWFVMCLFAFALGWLINKVLGWKHGGKVVFAVIVATVFISVVMISVFNDYFGIDQLLTENLILYSLRNITLGAMGFFGMTLAQLLYVQQQNSALEQKNSHIESLESSNNKNADLVLREAKLNAEKMVFDAQSKAREYEERLRSFESRLKELIHMEKELIKSYEDDNN